MANLNLATFDYRTVPHCDDPRFPKLLRKIEALEAKRDELCRQGYNRSAVVEHERQRAVAGLIGLHRISVKRAAQKPR